MAAYTRPARGEAERETRGKAETAPVIFWLHHDNTRLSHKQTETFRKDA